MTAARRLTLVLTSVVAACSGALSPDSHSLRGNLVLTRQLAENASAVTGRYLSVIDSFTLSITGGGTDQTIARRFGASESSVSIPVTLPASGAGVFLQIFSNNKVLLFSGATSPSVDHDGFSVAVPLVAVRPALLVFPDTLKIDSIANICVDGPNYCPPFRYASVTVHNSGKDSLSWNVARDIAGTQTVCISLTYCAIVPVSSGKVAASGDVKLIFTMPNFGGFPAGTMTYRFTSPEGTVVLPWRYPAPPPG